VVFLGGLPITAVIVRSSANAEADARTKLSAIFHGIWLLVLVFFAASILNMIPYCVLAVILIRTGYNLAKPRMIAAVYKLGREQFLPFIVTIVAMLFTDLLVGVGIGIAYSCYFIFKNTYKLVIPWKQKQKGISLIIILNLPSMSALSIKKGSRTSWKKFLITR
jgi:MFS superfamily sulfate permease-like transporter